jgi:hypothetical protein
MLELRILILARIHFGSLAYYYYAKNKIVAKTVEHKSR